MTLTQNDTSALGNTRTNARSRKWVFTLNNWTKDEFDILVAMMTQKKGTFCIGKEIGECGTPHLQGYVEFKNARTFDSLKKINDRIHWEKARGNRKQNVLYCSKDNNVTSTFPLPLKNRLLKQYDDVEWRPWQRLIIDIIESDVIDTRSIHWFWEPKGNVGKSYLCKYLYLKYDAIIASGKKDNIFNQIKIWMDAHEDTSPNIILVDIPRTNLEYINYSALEEIKNGLIYSGKYEGGVCAFECPKVIVFANDTPDTNKMSEDRWKIHYIN